jgi:hypothetical protein
MVALANLYTILDVSIQQIAVGLAILPSLVALAWYVSQPAHRRQCRRPRADEAFVLLARGRSRGDGDGSLAKAIPPRAWSEPAPLSPQE